MSLKVLKITISNCFILKVTNKNCKLSKGHLIPVEIDKLFIFPIRYEGKVR